MFEALVADGIVERDRMLGPLTTYKLGGPAAFYAEAETEAMLITTLTAWREQARETIPVLVLGRGSNVVISDRGFEGLVVRLVGDFLQIEIGATGIISGGSAVALPRLARAAVQAGRGGLEFFVGVPGSVGGAVRMNAGCHGRETKGSLLSARIFDAADGSITERDPEDLGHSYRHSNLSYSDVVLSAQFHTTEQETEIGLEEIRAITQWRRKNQPGGTFNAGSVFKNPPSISAGELIDSIGLKGLAVGGASVSRRHANFFVVGSGASAQDLCCLVYDVQCRVADASGIWLEPEIQFAGVFEECNTR